ncbi:LacI family DNA-binding transcriptional regulator [Clostridium perfringens]|uniref:LacI family DNA-binding transcriptional regulator n=1 Tax=Clostridium perfringens TaxID=1502 RepID=UPI001C8629AB|nr:LacI family DNA-binding transcriptional regulator [Clostridium perfringens]MCX0394877.1 LacI family transcriptional regulator [Clostridium perfringens]MDK0573682.1 LacI family DNA-binding transcriptional regulator [Clostridium perfringens]MDK0615468.1 LacI family DNA-binding transcriptional regulator [Clostridium perfringens]MDK0918522.1 LacI family DNA-binding transcriptional regulator [Clostridium perfringens]MDK0933779.1 LacI family DNA-binding transcriptional regulator [Clostridium perf
MQIKDIAKIAGVGVGTVSRVINNCPDVSEKTRRKVSKIIEKYNYVPNNNARLLKMNDTKNICVFVRGVYNPFFSEIVNYIREEISKAGYFMILQQEEYKNGTEEIKSMLSLIKENKLKGIISLGAQLYNIDSKLFNEIKVPIVFTSADVLKDNDIGSISTIKVENRYSSYKGVKYLINKGHRNIAILLGDIDDKGISIERFNGYKRALFEENFLVNKRYIKYGKYDCKSAYEKTLELLEESKEVTAIFAISDLMAVGAAKAITDKGLRVGEDIALLGFDGMDMTKYYFPGISTIEQPKERLAKESINLLLDLINKKSKNKNIVIETNLLERESTIKEF